MPLVECEFSISHLLLQGAKVSHLVASFVTLYCTVSVRKDT